MEHCDLYDQKTENLFASCDLLLLRLYFKMEVISGFPDVPAETVEYLESLGLLVLKDERCYITPLGQNAVSLGGVKNFVAEKGIDYPEPHMNRRNKILMEYPVMVGVLLSLILIICILTWFMMSV